MKSTSRREFIKIVAAGSAGLSLAGISCFPGAPVPSYLKEYASLYHQDPHRAALQWFKDVKYGLFMHYGISSLLGRGEWVQYREDIPLRNYVKLKDEFKADKFDAEFITDLALEAGMKYVNITSRHHDSFCLFESSVTDYSSVNAPAKRDLVGDLSFQCQKKGLGLFLYYSYALDWWHPYFYPRQYNRIARPKYENPKEIYKWRRDEDFLYYIEFVHTQIKELLTNYGPIAGIWFDPIMGYYGRPDLFPIDESYAMIRKLQPQTLISFKQGATGTEDFAAPERSGHSLADRVRQLYDEERAMIAENAWMKNKDKHNEICDTLQPGAWGYRQADDDAHHPAEKVVSMLINAASRNFNLLLNTGPLPDGTIHPEDVKSLQGAGKWLLENGNSIYKTDGGPFLTTNLTASTFQKNRIYIHVLNPTPAKLNIPVPGGLIKGLSKNKGGSLNYTPSDKGLSLEVGEEEISLFSRVINLELNSDTDPLQFKDFMITYDIQGKYKSIVLKNTPSERYAGMGILTLEDSNRGDLDHTSRDWLGFEENDFDAVVDMGEIRSITRIEVGFMQNQKSWIFLPSKITFLISDDGKKWREFYSRSQVNKKSGKTIIKNFTLEQKAMRGRYVRVIAKNIKKCPHWHMGAGDKAWLFVDEIVID